MTIFICINYHYINCSVHYLHLLWSWNIFLMGMLSSHHSGSSHYQYQSYCRRILYNFSPSLCRWHSNTFPSYTRRDERRYRYLTEVLIRFSIFVRNTSQAFRKLNRSWNVSYFTFKSVVNSVRCLEIALHLQLLARLMSSWRVTMSNINIVTVEITIVSFIRYQITS